MKKKKLQIKEIKVKSFVTLVNKEEQRTTKGGYVSHPRVPAEMAKAKAIGSHWTSEKTRATNSDDVLITFSKTNQFGD